MPYLLILSSSFNDPNEKILEEDINTAVRAPYFTDL